MSEFQTGLEFVRDSLSKMKPFKSELLHASHAALERLLAARSPEPVADKGKWDGSSPTGSETSRENSPAVIDKPEPKRTPQDQDSPALLQALRDPVLACTKCPHLVKSRTQVVFGVGDPRAELMFVGEAPGADEDLQGEPFVGKAGQLLTRIIETMGFQREDVYIANVLKCRPDMPPGQSGNRRPTTFEMQTCLPYLRRQIEIIQPRVLVALGAIAMEGLTGTVEPMRKLRGRWHTFQGTPLMATYHPAYLLRNQSLSEKRKVWEDMLMVLEKLERPVSERQRNFFLKKN
jgi:uracil-DNA glycosylase family 4